MGESHHGDHVRSVHSGPLLHHDMPGACPSLYSGGGRLGRHSSEVVEGIIRKGMKHLLMLMVNPKLLLLPLHRHLLRNEGSGRKT